MYRNSGYERALNDLGIYSAQFQIMHRNPRCAITLHFDQKRIDREDVKRAIKQFVKETYNAYNVVFTQTQEDVFRTHRSIYTHITVKFERSQ